MLDLMKLLAFGWLVTMLGCSLAGLGLVVGAVLPQRTATAVQALQPAAVRLGLLHGLGLLILLNIGEHRPLVKMVGLLWLLLAALCLLVGLAALVQRLAGLLFAQQPGWRGHWGAGLTCAWAFAFPVIGQLLALLVLAGAYAAGLQAWLRSAPRAGSTAPLYGPENLLPRRMDPVDRPEATS